MAVAIKPAYAEAHINLGKIAIDHKKYELGEKACLEAIEADPAIAHPYVNLCMLKRLQGQFDESIRYGKKGVELAQLSGSGHSNIGKTKMNLAPTPETLACSPKVIALQPHIPSTEPQ